jgi:c-di-GMP-binding flagellar brake protein YcgR
MPKTNMPLPIALNMEVVVEIAGASRINFRLVGCLETQYLILKVPRNAENYAMINFKPGIQVIARYHFNGQIFGFRSRLLVYTTVPDKLIFIEYPESYDEHSVRSKPRISCLLPATLLAAEKRFSGTIIDISASGCSWRSAKIKAGPPADLKFEGKLQLAINFPGVAQQHTVQCQQKNVKSDSELLCLGIEFIDLKTTDAEQINAYLHLGFIDENR